jgi:A/G-specific adenine glycosylase
MERYTGVSIASGGWVKTLQQFVISWFSAHGRDFPWRNTKDPFHILVAEVLLRQTQATRLVKPYLELTSKYPDSYALAKADIGELRAWFKPLGLVKRADCLVQTARLLVDDYQGQVPKDLKVLISMPGIGIYSSRAVLCLGFGVPVPMIDEGSGRVLRRILDMAHKGPAYCDSDLLKAAEAIIFQASCRDFNLGLIDIAAAYCKTQTPQCADCPLFAVCSFGGRAFTIW